MARDDNALERLLTGANAPEHPEVSFLRDLTERGASITSIEVWGSVEELPDGPPGVFVRLVYPNGNPDQRRVEWSPSLERFLFEAGIKATNESQESLRGANLLLQNVRAADMKWGKDYVNAVLHGLLHELYPKQPVIQDLLDHVPAGDPSGSRAFSDCYQYLENCLRGYGNSLVMELGYKSVSASTIFTHAIAMLFDARHRITSARKLFPNWRPQRRR